MFNRYARAVFSLPLEGEYTYRIPPDLEVKGELKPGVRVKVLLRGKEETALVTGIESTVPEFECLNIEKILDTEPVVIPEQMDLASWMADYYFSTKGECLFRMFPDGRRQPGIMQETPSPGEPLHTLNREQSKIYSGILESLEHAGEAENRNSTPVHLIHGITGSGKTEIYIHLMKEAWKKAWEFFFWFPRSL